MRQTAVIQCATPPEFAALHEAFGKPALEKAGKRQFFAAPSFGCVVLRGSIGKVWAAASTEFAIGRWQPGLVIDFGAAGALMPGLKVSDIVLADKVFEHDLSAAMGGQSWVLSALGPAFAELHAQLSSEAWLQKVPAYPQFLQLDAGLRMTRGHLAAGDKDIQSIAERAALAERVGAIAATWESSAIGRVCKFHGVPYLSVRAITDIGTGEFLAEYKAGAARALLPAAQLLVKLFEARTPAPR